MFVRVSFCLFCDLKILAVTERHRAPQYHDSACGTSATVKVLIYSKQEIFVGCEPPFDAFSGNCG